jgi:hypothetical protein
MVAKIVRVPAKVRLWEQAELAATRRATRAHQRRAPRTRRTDQEGRSGPVVSITQQITVGGTLKEGFAWKKPTVFSTAELHAIFSRKFQYWSRGVFFVRRTARLQRDFTVNVHLSNASVRLFFLKRLFALTKTFQFDQPEK